MTKGGGWFIGLLFCCILCVQGHTQDDYNQNGLDCWDECIFEQADDSKSTSALSMLYDIINRVRHLRIFDGVSLNAMWEELGRALLLLSKGSFFLWP